MEISEDSGLWLNISVSEKDGSWKVVLSVTGDTLHQREQGKQFVELIVHLSGTSEAKEMHARLIWTDFNAVGSPDSATGELWMAKGSFVTRDRPFPDQLPLPQN